ncbi:MAG: mannose-1-phosphate guanylyltransferase [Candidatus Eisenbacteria bacterium]|jgi:mannose-1-phosphate guanylyltransferase|nr:mannose-1-phosphate guanylyltransferase [Candidatus Eisenbacteria bacterium]
MALPTTRPGALILAGGRGERFWPWSTAARPKQLLPLARGGRTLLAATFERACRIVEPSRVVVMTAESLVDACRAECPGAVVVGEPVMRNTAPAIAAAAAFFGPGDPFAVLPSDHAIDDEDAFEADFRRAMELAARDAVLVTFGIKPTAPETNFGYVKRGAKLADRLHRVAQFTEKPDRDRATAWVASGEYAWNSGMFVWTRRTFMAALEAGRPAIAAPLAGLSFAPGQEREFEQALRDIFPSLESISVDYAVLEGSPNTVVIEAGFDWDDLGSWSAWARREKRDERGNVVFGDAVPVECDNCIVVGDGVTAAPLRLKDMIVVATKNGVLACHLDDSEHVRKVSEAVRARVKA